MNNQVLVIDADEMILETIETFFPSDDFEIVTSSSASDGLAKFDASKPSVVVCSARMPEKSGIEIVAEIKQKPDICEIVFITSPADFVLALTSLKVGVCDIILKPVDMDLLETTIRRASELVRLREAERGFQQEKAQLEEENRHISEELNELRNTMGLALEEKERQVQEMMDTLKIELNAMREKAGEKATSEDELQNELIDLKSKISKLDLGKKDIDSKLKEAQVRESQGKTAIDAALRCQSVISEQEITQTFESMIKSKLGLQTKVVFFGPGERTIIEASMKQGDMMTHKNVTGVAFIAHQRPGILSVPADVDKPKHLLTLTQCAHMLGYILSMNDVLEQTRIAMKKEINTRKVIGTILANLQMYIKKVDAVPKIEQTNENIRALGKEITETLFVGIDAMEKIKAVKTPDMDEHLSVLEEKVSFVAYEKSQSFDFICQKVEQLAQIVINLELGLKGQKMKVIEGDQYLFDKDKAYKV